MDENIRWHRETLLARTAGALNKNGFRTVIASSAQDALRAALELIRPGDRVGLGGSATISEIGLAEALRERGNTLVVHTPGAPKEQSLRIRREALGADVYLASPNAVTAGGRLVFMDSLGNRAAGMMFGPRRIIAVAGFNKIVEDEEAGYLRIETTAAPINAKRLGLETPCARTGVCADCDSPQRICNVAVTLLKCPRHADYHIILVDGELGY